MNIIELLEANKSFASQIDKKLLKELVEKGQKPVVTIVSCSDSRVPVEIIFNQLKLGTFFVVRVAGNIVSDSSVKGSIEYAVVHLNTPYLIILGHTECGAVKASLAGTNEGEIGKLVNNMKLESKELSKAVVENVELQVKRVCKMDCVEEALYKKLLEVYGMLYDLSTGKVKCLSKNGAPYNGGLK
ncbi:carbonic anhydrase [Chloroflexota bacterium]